MLHVLQGVNSGESLIKGWFMQKKACLGVLLHALLALYLWMDGQVVSRL